MFGKFFTGRASVGIEEQDSVNNHTGGIFRTLYNIIRSLLNTNYYNDELVDNENNSNDEQIINISTEEDNSVREYTPPSIEGDNEVIIADSVNICDQDAAAVAYPIGNMSHHLIFPSDPRVLDRINILRDLHEDMGYGHLSLREAINIDNCFGYHHAEVVGVTPCAIAHSI